MIRFLLSLAVLTLFISGCVNKRGISARYYNDCREYYDMDGYYHKKCDENLIEFNDVRNSVKETFSSESPETQNKKVW